MPGPDPCVQASAEPDDSAAGLAMFLIFTAAVLIVTGAVILVALVGGWWLLGVALAIHLLMTTIVVLTIVSVMNGRATASTERGAADTRREARPAGRHKSVAAL